MMTPLQIYVDRAASGRVMAHLLEPPALGVRFGSWAEMAHHLPGHLEAHLTWLRRHGEPVPAGPVVFVVAEEVAIDGNFESGDDVGFYAPDAVAPTPEDVERHLRIAGWAHADLLNLVAPLDDAVLDWVRDESTRPIRGILRHIVGAELWYMTRLIDIPDVAGLPDLIREADARCDATEDMPERVRIVWPAFQQWSRRLTPEQRARVHVPTWRNPPGERWSARKMLRRCIEHCREHTGSIQRILAAYQPAAIRHGGGAAAETERI